MQSVKEFFAVEICGANGWDRKPEGRNREVANLSQIWRGHTALNHCCELGPQRGHEGLLGKTLPDAFLLLGTYLLYGHWHANTNPVR